MMFPEAEDEYMFPEAEFNVPMQEDSATAMEEPTAAMEEPATIKFSIDEIMKDDNVTAPPAPLEPEPESDILDWNSDAMDQILVNLGTENPAPPATVSIVGPMPPPPPPTTKDDECKQYFTFFVA